MSDIDPKRCPGNRPHRQPPDCPYSHLRYVQHFIALVDVRPTPLSSLPSITPTFAPLLAPVPGSSPPQYTVSLPLPRNVFVVGRLASHTVGRALEEITGLSLNAFALLNGLVKHVLGSPPTDWLALRAEGDKESVDVLMECVLWLLESGVTLPDGASRSKAMEEHIVKFKESRWKLPLRSNEFYSLIFRDCWYPGKPLEAELVLPLLPLKPLAPLKVQSPTAKSSSSGRADPASPSPRARSSASDRFPPAREKRRRSPSPSPSPRRERRWSPERDVELPESVVSVIESSGRVCMANLESRRCPQGSSCPHSHLPYVDQVAALCITEPQHHPLPPTTPDFRPVLAVNASRSLEYLVSLPLPRIRAVCACMLGPSGIVFKGMGRWSGARAETELKNYRYFVPGEEPVDWLCIRGRGTKAQVDALVEAVLWMMEKGLLMSSMVDAAAELERHLSEWKLLRADAVLGPDDFFALTTRGAPPLGSGLARALGVVEEAGPYAPEAVVTESPVFSPSSWLSAAAGSYGDGAAMESGPSHTSDLWRWVQKGATKDVSSAVFVPDCSSDPEPYFRSLPDTTFACIPIVAATDVREMFGLERVEGAVLLSEVEKTYTVSVYVPQMTEAGREHGYLNVTVWKNVTEGAVPGSERPLVEDAARALLRRYEAVLRLLRPGQAVGAASFSTHANIIEPDIRKPRHVI